MKKKQNEIERSLEISKRAAELGFDFESYVGAMDKIREECAELSEVLQESEERKDRIEDEFGDLFFSLLNLCRKIDVDPWKALRGANEKFLSRFAYVEKNLVGKENVSLERMEIWWGEAKNREKA